MTSRNPTADQIALDALEVHPQSRRAAYLDSVCGSDEALRSEVEQLLMAPGISDASCDDPLGDSEKTTPFQLLSGEFEEPMVGPYRLLSLIAEGGMGVVYEAEQQEPVRRFVAVKIIKPGTDSQDVIARFEIERQTLALMDHPNIASVLDAGSTRWGQPYFVMELVRGTPITQHCDERHLGVPERLQLFMQVCHAVQHAHMKGIIHRDIKPSNVLVTMKDGVPVPKVIDFGVAKALDQPISEQTLRARFNQMVGTPIYMSPEQASLDCHDVDTRSDVYSLGIVLYELLTGTTPCDAERLDKATFADFCRLKSGETPPLPSSRVTTLDPAAIAAVADRRGLRPAHLSQFLRGELDWIVMRALEKDRCNRYQTARGLATDLANYLNNRPVEAVPPTRSYRIRKFVSRQRGWITAATIMALMLVLGTVVSVWQAIRATNAERLAREQMAIARQALRDVEIANNQSRRNRAQALSANGSFLMAVKRYDLALQQFEAAWVVDSESSHLNNNFAWFLATCPNTQYANPQRGVQLALKAVELVPDEGTFWNTLGVCYYRAGRYTSAIESLERSNELFGNAGIGFNAMFLAMAHWRLGHHEDALQKYQTALRWMQDNAVVDEELARFLQETAVVLQQPEPELPKAPLGVPPNTPPTGSSLRPAP